MLTENLRLMIRQSIVSICSGLFLATFAVSVFADPTDSPVRREKDESQPVRHSVFGDIVQIGGKLSGKAAHAAPEPKGLPDLDAKGASDNATRKAAIAALPSQSHVSGGTGGLQLFPDSSGCGRQHLARHEDFEASDVADGKVRLRSRYR
ncbi:MAG: hypothetical protein HY290_01360 [Planctomycetia bacterium]|nr:hypothetical protein [Planctomycetia bacterium]